mgnify:CR=1 FL=1
MPLVIGLCLIPLVVLIIISANSVKTTRKAKFWLNFSLVALVILYFVFVAVVNKEPFKMEITLSEISLISGARLRI